MSRGKGEDLVAEMMPAFISEVNEQIESIEGLLLQLEDQAGDPELLDALFRCAHTIKGSAGVFGIEPVVEFTHHVETVLDGLRDGTLQSTPALSTLLLQCNDAIRTMVNSPDDAQSAQAIVTRRELVERLHAVSGATVASAADPAAADAASCASTSAAAGARWRITVRFLADTFRHGMDPLSILNYLGGKGTIESLECDRGAIPTLDTFDPESCHLAFRFDFLTAEPRERIEHAFGFVREDCELDVVALDGVGGERPADAVATGPAAGGAVPPAGEPKVDAAADGRSPTPAAGNAPGTGTGTAAAAIDDGGYIRIPARRLDEVITLLGELVIAGAGNSQLARQARQRALIESSQQMSRLIEGIRNSTLKLRMVPIGDTFTRFRRTVRDTAASLGKDVLLEIQGGDTELDKAMVERIADPLMHLVRNALDHGLETPEERREAGKPAQGRLTLSACHESGSVLIRIIDDGRGIRRSKVLERAWERGLVERGVVPPDNDILALIFEPGFSTAEQVTNLSGRGVGMDVVRSNIEGLRGTVAIESTEGAGSTIEIRLPLTLAIIDGFLVCVGDSNFIFPLDTVVEVIASNRMAELDDHGRGCVTLRGSLLPVIDLRTLYALEGDTPDKGSIVVVRIGARRFGVMVDSLLGQHQTVIKPLGQLLRSLRGISGSSILGTGEVALIFDVDALGRIAVERRAVNERERVADPSSAGRHPNQRQGSTS